MRRKKISAFVVCLLLILTFFYMVDVSFKFIPTASGTTIFVPTDYPTIQEAVDAANDGDTVFVYGLPPGVHYYEWILIDKNINLIGEDRNTTIIDGGGHGTIIGIAPLAEDVTISGFSIIYGDNGIWVGGGPVTISNNEIYLMNGEAIWVDSSDNIITNNIIDWSKGIRLDYTTSKNTIKNNTFLSLTSVAVSLYSSRDNNLTGNTMTECGFYINGNFEDWTQNYIDTSNTVNGKPVYYWKNQIGGSIPPSAGQVILANCSNVIIENQELNDCTIGIEIGYSSKITITESDVMRNWYGIYIWYSDEINISHNYVSSNGYGIDINFSERNNVTYNTIYSHDVFDVGKGINLWYSKENYIAGNDVSYNWNGIFLESSNDNNIFGNSINSNNHYGIYIASSNSNNIIENNISTNDVCNIYIQGSSNSHIYHNNIVNDDWWWQAQDFGSNNKWDNGYPSGGNYWSDYGGVDNFRGPSQDILGSDGIGDTPYDESFTFQDNYPLMGAYKPLENYTILSQGWNLISIPLIQVEQDITTVLGFIDGWYDVVQWYNPTDLNDPWKNQIIGKPFGNDLSELNETMGVWIRITQPGDTIFVYNGTEPIQNQTIPLYSGWNLVGYPSPTNYNRTNGLNNLTFGSEINSIWSFNSITQTWKELSEIDYFESCRGYFIHAKSDCIWEVPL